MYFIPGDLPFWTRVGDAGNSCLNHQLRTIVELHPNLSARQLQIQTNKDLVFVKVSIHIPSLKILISHLLPGTPIQHLAQISTWPPFLCSGWGPVALGSFSYSGWLWWSQTHRRKSSRYKSVKIKCRSHHGLHTHTWLQVLFLCFDFFTISLLVVLWKESVCLKPVNTAYTTCFCLRRLSVWRGNPHYSSFYPVMSELTEGVICGGLGGDAVSGGTGCEGADDEPGASELTGLLGSKRKQTFVTQDEKYNKKKRKKKGKLSRGGQNFPVTCQSLWGRKGRPWCCAAPLQWWRPREINTWRGPRPTAPHTSGTRGSGRSAPPRPSQCTTSRSSPPLAQVRTSCGSLRLHDAVITR